MSKLGERLEEILIDFLLSNDKKIGREISVRKILEAFRQVVPEAKVPGKHDGHPNDDNSWCYECNESGPEEEFTNVYIWNACREQLLKELEG